MTVDDIIDSCADSRSDDWAFWVYLCDDARAAGGPSQEGAQVRGWDIGSCARAVCLRQRAIGLAWMPAMEDEIASLPAFAPAVAEGERVYHWVELLYEGAVVYRHLAVWLDGARASLPVPLAELHGDGSGPTLWVSRRAHRLARLANEVDPDCSDFDDWFAASGIELRAVRRPGFRLSMEHLEGYGRG